MLYYDKHANHYKQTLSYDYDDESKAQERRKHMYCATSGDPRQKLCPKCKTHYLSLNGLCDNCD